MKKVSKFRKWLIRKLGGICLDEKPIIIENKVSPFTLSSRIELSREEVNYLADYFPRGLEKEIKENLWQKLGEQAIPLMTFTSRENKKLNTMVFKARLTIVREANNDTDYTD